MVLMARDDHVFVTSTRRYAMGVDLGQAADYTAISVIEYAKEGTGEWKHPPRGGKGGIEIAEERYNLLYLERVPLHTPYPDIVAHVAELLVRPPLAGKVELVIDMTGVGRPVFDLFQDAGQRPIGVSITAGTDENRKGSWRYNVSKQMLISTLDAKLHTGEFRYAPTLENVSEFVGELVDFRRKVTAAGHATWSHRTGAHDDLVLSCCLALWWLARPRHVNKMIRIAGF